MSENSKSDLIIYTTEDGLTKVDVTFEEDTVWLTQEQMSDLFQKAKSTINEHIKNIYKEGELKQELTMRKFGNSEFSTKPTNYYNLDVVISVGYRVKSQRGVQFRIWASGIIKEYMKKGFALDDNRLKELGDGEELLHGNGSISHEQAMEKAEMEYKKYKTKTLSDVEKDFLNSIKALEAIKEIKKW